MKYHIEDPQSYRFKIYENYRRNTHLFKYSRSTVINYQISAVFSILSEFIIDNKLPIHKIYDALFDKIMPVDINIQNGNYAKASRNDMFEYMMYDIKQIARLHNLSIKGATRLKKEAYFLITGMMYKKRKDITNDLYPNTSTITTQTIG